MASKNYQAKETMLVITVGFLVLYFVFKKPLFLDLALVTGLIGVFSFYLSGKIDLAWGWLSRMLGKVSNTVLLGIVFFVVVTPVGLVRRLAKKGQMKRFEPGAGSNFSRRGHRFEKKDLENTWVWAVLFLGAMAAGTGAFAQGASAASAASASATGGQVRGPSAASAAAAGGQVRGPSAASAAASASSAASAAAAAIVPGTTGRIIRRSPGQRRGRSGGRASGRAGGGRVFRRRGGGASRPAMRRQR